MSKLTLDYKNELNEEQLAVVEHKKRNALVIAGAGSGKTRALTYRVAYLIDMGAPPESIVLVTFTKKAAQEMIERVEKLIGNRAKEIKAGTFHHLANVFMRPFVKSIGFTPNYTILDRGDQKTLMKNIRAQVLNEDMKNNKNIKNLKGKELNTLYPKATDIINLNSLRINFDRHIKQLMEERYPHYLHASNDYSVDIISWVERVIQRFILTKKKNNVMDFDDMLNYFLKLLEEKKTLTTKVITRKVRHVLVDEYQDVNQIQARIVQEISRDAKSLTVVGDDAQSIYSFRGADFTHMLKFEEFYGGENSITLKLLKNYRSTPEILKLANSSINHNKKQFKKALESTRNPGEKPCVLICSELKDEADSICDMILEFREQNIRLNEQAILFRARFNAFNMESALIKHNIPYVMRAGMRYFERAHIKDIIAFLSIIANPRDSVQWQRVLQLHNKITDLSAIKIIETLDLTNEQMKEHPLERFVNSDLIKKLEGKRIQEIGKRSLQKLQKFFRNEFMHKKEYTFYLYSEDEMPSLPMMIDKINEYYKPFLKEIYKGKDPDDRLADIEELRNFCMQFPNIQEFLSSILTQIELVGQSLKDGNKQELEKPIVLSTIHQSKGLEWKVVFVLNCIEGRLPNSRAIGDPDEIEEERRLFYVATTRARDYLYLSYPEMVFDKGRTIISHPSRFIEEIEGDEVFDFIELEPDNEKEYRNEQDFYDDSYY